MKRVLPLRLDAQTIRLESNIGSRTVGVGRVVQRYSGLDCLGVCIEEPFSGQFSSVKALFPMLGAAVLACELAGLPWSAIHFARLKVIEASSHSSVPKGQVNNYHDYDSKRQAQSNTPACYFFVFHSMYLIQRWFGTYLVPFWRSPSRARAVERWNRLRKR
jgi:hypothetical protein